MLRILYAIGVGLIALIVCLLIGAILTAVGLPQVGNFLKSYAALVGLLCGLWFFFVDGKRAL
jgi:hypothetical protein